MSDGVTPAPERYRFVPYGGGVEELDRFAVRDRIRTGDILPQNELAPLGTDDWKPASSYPELLRYFDLAATRSAPAVIPQKARDVLPMSRRVADGILYPLLGGQIVTVALLAVVSALPVVSILSSLATIGIMLEVIRKSADGVLKMPAVVDTSNIPHMLWLNARVLFVTVVALSPLIAFFPFAIVMIATGRMTAPVGMLGAVALLGFAAIYYPACLATIAVWNDALSALNPVYVFAVIRKTGRDYFIVVGIWFAATVVATIARMPVISPLAKIPFAGAMFGSFLSLWVLFYASHLLGYAIYRHAPALGWE